MKVDGSPVESFEVCGDKASPQYVVTQVKERSQYVLFEESAATTASAALTLPERTSISLTSQAANQAGHAGAKDAKDVVSGYVGDVSRRSGLSGLEAIDEVTMVVAPDLMAAYQHGALDREQVKAIQMAMVNHCENMANRMAILDPLPDMTPSDVYEWRQNEAGFDSKFAALYYPWIKVADPTNGRGFLMPPSGHIAGLWARSDEARGVHKAPANEVLRGVLDLSMQVTKGEQEQLNPAGINCIRSFPGRGIRVWGARTLASDTAWRYLNVRRLFNYLEESIYQGSQWVVFEPNDERLWATIRRNVSAFLVGEWRRGALFGITPEEEFYVKFDEDTKPPDVFESGQV
ncbi:phage tail sheath family protein, partial [Streptomyces formicae]